MDTAIEKCIMQALARLPLIKGFRPVKKPEVQVVITWSVICIGSTNRTRYY